MANAAIGAVIEFSGRLDDPANAATSTADPLIHEPEVEPEVERPLEATGTHPEPPTLKERVMSLQPKSPKNLFLATAVVAGFLAATTADRVSAQVRPAYTKNVDEPGRLPYEVEVEFQPGNCLANCSNFLALGPALIFDGPAIPAGKRAVIVWVSSGLPTSSTVNRIVLQSERSLSAFGKQKWSYAGPFFIVNMGGRPQAGMSSASFLTYGPGESPHFIVEVSSFISSSGSITLSGYLIDAVN